MAKIKIEDIQSILNEDGWKIESTEYKNLDSILRFRCKEGHLVESTWKKIRSKRECPICKDNNFTTIHENNRVIPKKKDTIRVLGLDQATHISGFSIFDGKELIYYGTFESKKKVEIERDDEIKMWLVSLIRNWKIDYVGIEGIQYQEQMGVTTFEVLARLQGILMEAAFEQKVPFIICPTNTWRAHCGVKGVTRADKKRSIRLIIKKLYDVTVSEDEADAIGIGQYTVSRIGPKTVIENWE